MKRTLSILLLLFMLLPLGACSANRDIDSFGIVSGVAIDIDENKQTVLTVEIINTSSGNAEETATSVYFTKAGGSISEAADKIAASFGKPLYWTHTSILILGNSCASDSIEDVVKWVMQSKALRISIPMVVANNCTGEELLKSKMESYNVTGIGLRTLLDSAYALSRCVNVPTFMIYDHIASESSYAVLPVISKTEDKLSIEGCAVFNGYKMECIINDEMTRTYLLLRDKLKDGLIASDGIAVNVIKSNCKEKVEQTDDRFSITYTVSLSLSLEQATQTEQPEEIKKFIEDLITDRIFSLVSLWHASISADFLEAANALHDQKPSLYQSIDKQKLKDMCDIYVDVHIFIKEYGET